MTQFRFQNLRLGLAAIAAAGAMIAGVASAEAPKPDLICSGKHDSAPVFLTRDQSGVVERLEIESAKDGSYRGRYVAVPADLLAELCRRGISLAAMPKPNLISYLPQEHASDRLYA